MSASEEGPAPPGSAAPDGGAAPAVVIQPLAPPPPAAPAQERPGRLAPTGGKIRPFRKRSVEWLKAEARRRGFSGYSKMKKGELVELLKGSKPPQKA